MLSPDPPSFSSQFSPSENEIYRTVGDWISGCLGNDFTILQAQQNRTPPPLSNFVTMLITNKTRLSTNGRHYQADQQVMLSASFMFTLQIACIGPRADEAALLLKTLWRDLSCCRFFQNNLPACAPVDSDNLTQSSLETAEKQYEDKWQFQLRLNVLGKICLPQEMMNEIHLKPDFISS